MTALSLPDATDVTYDIVVKNGSGTTVWSETELSSNAYGAVDGSGSFAYLGPCDADDPSHTVDLNVHDLVGLPADDWVDPGTMTKAFTCVEDQTASVAFDVTIAIDGEQGFVDATVDFDDIYCSASLDCEDGSGADLMLTQDAAGTRLPTARLGLTCSAGDDATFSTQTWLYMNDVTVTCGANSTDIDPTVVGLTIIDDANTLVESAMVTQGELDTTAAGETVFWTVSIGIDTASGGDDCTLTARATAADEELTANTTPTGSTYPVIDWNVPLRTAGADVCTRHAVNGGNGVSTEFTPDNAAETFEHSYSDGLPFDGMAAGADFSCARDTGGGITCWGAAAGSGVVSGASAIAAAEQVEGGDFHACARHADGTVTCWGDNFFEQLDGTSSITDAVHIDSGSFNNCAIDSSANLTCWGDTRFSVNTAGSARTNVVDVALGSTFGCDLDTAGAVTCWGEASPSGVTTSAPTITGGLDIAAGLDHACVIKSDGTVECWGDNTDGQAPSDPGVSNAIELDAGWSHTCALLADGSATCWGSDTNSAVSGASAVSSGSAIAASPFHTCAVDNGGATCWGLDDNGQVSSAP